MKRLLLTKGILALAFVLLTTTFYAQDNFVDLHFIPLGTTWEKMPKALFKKLPTRAMLT